MKKSPAKDKKIQMKDVDDILETLKVFLSTIEGTIQNHEMRITRIEKILKIK